MPKRLLSLWSRTRFYTGAAAIFLLNLKLFGVSVRSICTPGFNCHGCPYASFACPVGSITYGSSIRAIPGIALATVVVVGVTLGRLVCGFACPFGWFQDLLHRIPGPKRGLPRWTRAIKYVVLAALVAALPLALGYEQSTASSLYYCKVCPSGSLTAHLPNIFAAPGTAGAAAAETTETEPEGDDEPGDRTAIGGAGPSEVYGAGAPNWLRLGILAAFLFLMITVSRAFCRLMCPLGTMYGLFSRAALVRVEVDPEACVDCGRCDPVCPVGLDIRREAGGPECIACGDCIAACPTNAIRRRIGL